MTQGRGADAPNKCVFVHNIEASAALGAPKWRAPGGLDGAPAGARPAVEPLTQECQWHEIC